MNITYLLDKAIVASILAGNEIVNIYNSSYKVEYKNDFSPITQADMLSNNIITSYLAETNIPIVSEESIEANFSELLKWEHFWLVDPLDGTKEFIGKNGEFTVNIALIKHNYPLLGIIYSPLSGWLYFGSPETGSVKVLVQNSKILDRTMVLLPYRQNISSTIRVVVSRSHLDIQTESFLLALKEKYQQIEIIKSGSAIKLCKVAEGEADIYPRFGKTMEWDTAAGHAILLYANSNLYDINTLKPLTYGKCNFINPAFIAIRNNFQWY